MLSGNGIFRQPFQVSSESLSDMYSKIISAVDTQETDSNAIICTVLELSRHDSRSSLSLSSSFQSCCQPLSLIAYNCSNS